ncbi:MAG: NapC/NirT family cytochrome c [Rhizobiaceae bacterium]
MAEPAEKPEKTSFIKRYLFWGMPIAGALGAFAAGIIFWGGFNTVVEATNTETFCLSCHEMQEYVYEEYKGTIHDVNRSGVGAVCSDCHVPKDWTHKMIRKVKATRELYGKVMGTISTPEKFEAKRLHLAMNEWERMKANDSRECRNCHDFKSMLPEFQKPRARQQHLNAMEAGQTCIDCHKGIAHSDLRNRADPEYLESLEAPNPQFVRMIPQEYINSLARITEKEKTDAEAAKEKERADREAEQARIAAAVEAALAEERAKADGSDNAGSGDSAAGSVATDIDWSTVPETVLTLFYPGQASFEWVQNGRSHGGARPLTKGGDACTTCHANELETIGKNIVAGGEIEPTPIPGKRGTIDTTVQAAHDGQNAYFRLRWMDDGHKPAPFVEGGKMDPDNQIKVAMMITGSDIKLGDQVGCWASCHADNSYMPFDPGAEAIAANAEVASRLEATETITKYISESRTKIEIRGRRGKAQGGWDKLKPQDEIDQLLADGTFLDLLRIYADGSSSNGYLLERRIQNDGEMAAEARFEAGQWTVIFSRPLTGGVGDVPLEAGKTYTVGFAIHDDYSSARFHHVTLDTTLALENDEAAINVVAK